LFTLARCLALLDLAVFKENGEVRSQVGLKVAATSAKAVAPASILQPLVRDLDFWSHISRDRMLAFADKQVD
jgi:hypothetical protein